jgi:hypothetical protein
MPSRIARSLAGIADRADLTIVERTVNGQPDGPGPGWQDRARVRTSFRETLRWFGSDLMEARPEYILEADRDKTIVHHVAEGELFEMMRLMKLLAALLARGERT